MRDEYFEHFTGTYAIVRLQAHALVFRIDNFAQQHAAKLARLTLGIFLAALAAFALGGVWHPLFWLKLAVALWSGFTGVVVGLEVRAYRRLDLTKRKIFALRYKLGLKKCVWKHECPLRDQKWHMFKNWLAWVIGDAYGLPNGFAAGYFSQRLLFLLGFPILFIWAVRNDRQIY